MNEHVSLSLVYRRFFVKKFDNEEFSKTFIESNGRAGTNFSQFYELLRATLLNEKHGQNTFASAELNRVASGYFKTEMEKVLYIGARRRQGCALRHANNEIHYTKEKYVLSHDCNCNIFSVTCHSCVVLCLIKCLIISKCLIICLFSPDNLSQAEVVEL